METKQSQPRLGFGVEPLEPRVFLAGAVTAIARDGILRITGDGDANQLVISRDNDDSRAYRVEAVGGTSLNGSLAPLVFRNLSKGLFIDLGAGNDELIVSGAYVRGKLRIDAGAGDDAVLLRSVRVTSTFDYTGGAGNDHILIRKSTFHNAMTLDGGEGKDRTTLSFVDAAYDLSIEDTQGPSILSFTRLNVGRDATVVAGNSLDRLTIHDSTFESLVSMGLHNGDDQLRVRGTVFQEKPVLDVGAGENQIDREIILEWDFNNGAQGWEAGFADYPAASPTAEDSYELRSGIEPLPDELGIRETGFKVSGRNLSDDLFMYLSRKLDATNGIIAGGRYLMSYNVQYATDIFDGALIGYFKVGGLSQAPALVPGKVTPQQTIYRLNADIGNQANSGMNASVAGYFTNDQPPPERYASTRRIHTHPHPIAADTTGRIWLLAGVDSAYEVPATIYFQSIKVRLTPVAS